MKLGIYRVINETNEFNSIVEIIERKSKKIIKKHLFI